MRSWRVTKTGILRMLPGYLRPLLVNKEVWVALVTTISTIVLVPFETSILPLARKFRLDNPYIAYPYVPREHVPVWLLFLLAFALPFAIIVATGFLLSRYRKHAAVSALAFVCATVVTALVCDILKFLIGNQRPDFLARCQPRADAPLHEPLDVRTWCTSDNWFGTWEGCRSTPSGHSSVSFNGLGFLAFWIVDTFGLLHADVPLYATLGGFSPFLIAAFVAFTRIIDHKHHWFDIFFGAALGTVIAYYIYEYIVKTSELVTERSESRSEPLTA